MPSRSHCPACWGPGEWLGNLGQMSWMRCRRCGLLFSRMRARTSSNPNAATTFNALNRKTSPRQQRGLHLEPTGPACSPPGHIAPQGNECPFPCSL